METRRQGAMLFSAILVLVVTLIVIQLWIVAASLDALLASDTKVLFPALFASLGLFATNAGLLAYVILFDRRLRGVGR